jgi:hypothetical protein
MNAKDELLSHAKGRGLLCAEIYLGEEYEEPRKEVRLKINGDISAFLQELDVEYDAGYGSQYLDGIIWFKDGTWSTRGEYDGSEWWEHHRMPEIPERLKA